MYRTLPHLFCWLMNKIKREEMSTKGKNKKKTKFTNVCMRACITIVCGSNNKKNIKQ